MTPTTTTKGPPALTGEAAADAFGAYFKVPLSGRDGEGRFALLDLDGLKALQRAGARSLFLVSDTRGNTYVSFVQFPSRRPMTAARMILGDPRGQRVEYADGNRLNLRGLNLLPRRYAGVGDCRATEAAA
jgi:hypothetical protein